MYRREASSRSIARQVARVCQWVSLPRSGRSDTRACRLRVCARTRHRVQAPGERERVHPGRSRRPSGAFSRPSRGRSREGCVPASAAAAAAAAVAAAVVARYSWRRRRERSINGGSSCVLHGGLAWVDGSRARLLTRLVATRREAPRIVNVHAGHAEVISK